MPKAVSRRWLAAGLWGCALCTACPAAAEAGASVLGQVALDAVAVVAPAPRYHARTRAPIEPADPPRALAYLERLDGGAVPAAPEMLVEVAQRGYQFRPDMVAVPRHARVAFPNQDDEFHSVFSYSPAKRFDLGRFRKDEASPLVTFDQPGLVRVYCEIHKHMRGLVLVLDTPWFTATDSTGRFRIENVPAGAYRLTVVLPDASTRGTTIEVGGAGEIEIDPAALRP